MTEYERWLQQPLDDPDLTEELRSIQGNEEEINDRFYMDLEFGTAGLRGVIGAGINRMNVYTVRKATQGLSNYLLKHAQGKPSPWPLPTTAATKACCSPSSRRLCWLPTASKPISIPS